MIRSQAAPDRWSVAHQRLQGVLAPAAMNRWWITPLAKLHGITPIEAWEQGRQREVESIISDYARGRSW